MKRIPLALLLTLAVGCGSSTTAPIQPQYQPEIVNLTDSFSLQLTNVADGTGRFLQTWQNTGTRANIDRACAITNGTVNLTIRDAAGATVYANVLNGVTGSVSTAFGVAGAWSIQTDFNHATGTINFSAQKL